tara:strand:+ start:99 stop:425 length:327 start_codon:yes stop_codon:yes gene_type:complete
MTLKEKLIKKQELPSKAEIAGSKRWYKSATPKLTLDWWIKWTASLTLLSAMILRGAQVMPFVDLCLSFAGCAGWVVVSIMWKDRALIMLNTAACIILGMGILRVVAGG